MRRRFFALLSLTLVVAATPAPAFAATPTCAGRTATVVGTDGNDTLNGTNGPDVIVAKAGADTILGKGGADTICAGSGNDVVDGGSGPDRIAGQTGNDRLSAGLGHDRVYSGPGRDMLAGGAGDDYMAGGDDADVFDPASVETGSNTFDGGPGDDDFYWTGVKEGTTDVFRGGTGYDFLSLRAAVDNSIIRLDEYKDHGIAADRNSNAFLWSLEAIEGSSHHDTIRGLAQTGYVERFFGGPGNDNIHGFGGNDVLVGGADDDNLYGGPGRDVLSGSAGDDYAAGGTGSDRCNAEEMTDTCDEIY